MFIRRGSSRMCLRLKQREPLIDFSQGEIFFYLLKLKTNSQRVEQVRLSAVNSLHQLLF